MKPGYLLLTLALCSIGIADHATNSGEKLYSETFRSRQSMEFFKTTLSKPKLPIENRICIKGTRKFRDTLYRLVIKGARATLNIAPPARVFHFNCSSPTECIERNQQESYLSIKITGNKAMLKQHFSPPNKPVAVTELDCGGVFEE